MSDVTRDTARPKRQRVKIPYHGRYTRATAIEGSGVLQWQSRRAREPAAKSSNAATLVAAAHPVVLRKQLAVSENSVIAVQKCRNEQYPERTGHSVRRRLVIAGR